MICGISFFHHAEIGNFELLLRSYCETPFLPIAVILEGLPIYPYINSNFNDHLPKILFYLDFSSYQCYF